MLSAAADRVPKSARLSRRFPYVLHAFSVALGQRAAFGSRRTRVERLIGERRRGDRTCSQARQLRVIGASAGNVALHDPVAGDPRPGPRRRVSLRRGHGSHGHGHPSGGAAAFLALLVVVGAAPGRRKAASGVTVVGARRPATRATAPQDRRTDTAPTGHRLHRAPHAHVRSHAGDQVGVEPFQQPQLSTCFGAAEDAERRVTTREQP